MKRYISAILIPCFLLQLFGCYSTREITLDELKNFENAQIITKDSTIYNLSEEINEHNMLNNPNEYFSDYWIINKDSSRIDLIAQRSYSKNVNDLSVRNMITKKISIPFKAIEQLSVEKYDAGKTWLGIGITIGVLGIIVAISLANTKVGPIDLASKFKL
jgi:general stress protein CsbA